MGVRANEALGLRSVVYRQICFSSRMMSGATGKLKNAPQRWSWRAASKKSTRLLAGCSAS